MQSRFTHRLLASAGAAACAAALLLAQPASAQTAAIQSFTSTQAFQSPGFTVGYTFTLSQSVIVTSLGYFDLLGNGLVENHQVAIYSSNGATQLVTATVTTASPLGNTFSATGAGNEISGFRYATSGPTVLAAGSYTIGAYTGNLNPSDAFFYSAAIVPGTSFTFGSGIASATPGGLSATAPVGNTGGASGVSYFGPSFTYTVGQGVAGPEPGTVALLATGLLGMGGIRIRSRRKKAAK